MTHEPALPLEGLYLNLVEKGFPLSVRDYRDALTALRRGYGLHSPGELAWLCETLWARTDQERSYLQRLFAGFPETRPDTASAAPNEPGSGGTAPPAGETGPSSGTGGAGSAEAATPEQSPIVEFGRPGESGVALPRAMGPVVSGEAYIFEPRSPIALRSLIVAWRRYRRAQRAGPPTELDLDATIAEQGRRGLLAAPVLVAARRNQARLLVLVDASPSMRPWSALNTLLPESLAASQLAEAPLYFFDNGPDEALFAEPALTRPLPLDEVIRKHSDCPLLIVGDAGAAKGRIDRTRWRRTQRFLQEQRRQAEWHPVAWLNPMPSSRWAGTSAERIAALPGLAMMALTEDGLVAAIDHLRGRRGG